MHLLSLMLDTDPATTAGLGLAALSGVCAFAAAFLKAPTAESGNVYRTMYAIVNWGGWNKFRATNADDVRRIR